MVLRETIRQNGSIYRTIKEGVKAKLKVTAKGILRKYANHRDIQMFTIGIVLIQAILIAK